MRALSTSACIAVAISVRLEMSLIEKRTMPSRAPLRMALSTIEWICSSVPISVKIRGASCGLICHRRPASIVIPICSLESASIGSASSPAWGNCSSRVE